MRRPLLTLTALKGSEVAADFATSTKHAWGHERFKVTARWQQRLPRLYADNGKACGRKFPGHPRSRTQFTPADEIQRKILETGIMADDQQALDGWVDGSQQGGNGTCLGLVEIGDVTLCQGFRKAGGEEIPGFLRAPCRRYQRKIRADIVIGHEGSDQGRSFSAAFGERAIMVVNAIRPGRFRVAKQIEMACVLFAAHEAHPELAASGVPLRRRLMHGLEKGASPRLGRGNFG